MDIALLKMQLEAERTFESTVDGVTFTVRLPNDYDMRAAYEDTRHPDGHDRNTQAFRGLLLKAVRGWSGLTAAHLTDSAPAEAVSFSAETLLMLLDARQDIADALTQEIVSKRVGRLEKTQAAEKN